MMNNNSESSFGKLFCESFSTLLKRNKEALDLFAEQINECKKLYLLMSENDENSSFYSTLSSTKKSKFQEDCQLLQEVIAQQESILNELKAIYREQEKLLETKELSIGYLETFNKKFQEGLNVCSRINKKDFFLKSCLEESEKTPDSEEERVPRFQK